MTYGVTECNTDAETRNKLKHANSGNGRNAIKPWSRLQLSKAHPDKLSAVFQLVIWALKTNSVKEQNYSIGLTNYVC